MKVFGFLFRFLLINGYGEDNGLVEKVLMIILIDLKAWVNLETVKIIGEFNGLIIKCFQQILIILDESLIFHLHFNFYIS